MIEDMSLTERADYLSTASTRQLVDDAKRLMKHQRQCEIAARLDLLTEIAARVFSQVWALH